MLKSFTYPDEGMCRSATVDISRRAGDQGAGRRQRIKYRRIVAKAHINPEPRPFSSRGHEAPETRTAQEHGRNNAKREDPPVAERVADIAEKEHQQPSGRKGGYEKNKDGKQGGSDHGCDSS
jgi:hypothetical protein